MSMHPENSRSFQAGWGKVEAVSSEAQITPWHGASKAAQWAVLPTEGVASL